MKKILLLGTILLSFLSFFSPNILAQASDTFTYVVTEDPQSTNPLTAADRGGYMYKNLIYSPLVKTLTDGTKVNVLAESVDVSEDGLKMTFNLRKGVKWSDGEDFNADDVLFTYGIFDHESYGDNESLYIDGEKIKINKLDDYTIEFVLPKASAAAINLLPSLAHILPEHIYKDVQDFSVNDFDIDPVGTGPYVLEEYKRGEYLKFKANVNYFEGKPNIPYVVMRVVPDSEAAKTALKTGEVDASLSSPSQLDEFQEAGLDTYPFSEGRVGYVGFNMLSDKVQDKNLRKAILYALNKDEINLAAYGSKDLYQDADSIFAPNHPYYSDTVEKYSHDLEKAKELIKTAGIDKLDLSIVYTAGDANSEKIATLMKEQLNEIGINLELNPADPAAMYAELENPESTKYDLYMNGYVLGMEPDEYRYMFSTKGAYNFSHFNLPQVDELFKKGRETLDLDDRKLVYQEIQELLAEEAIFYPYAVGYSMFVSNPRIKGYEEAGFAPIYVIDDFSKLKIEE